MTQGFDIDELERLLAAATPGEWVVTEGVEISAGNLGVIIECMYSENQESDEANAALIVTLKRSAPAMIAAIRELRAENARLKAVVCNYVDPFNVAPEDEALVERVQRAALGEPQ